MTTTDEIYMELKEGLKTGLDYDEIRLRWEKSKGAFYNALQRVFAEECDELFRMVSEKAALQKKVDADRLTPAAQSTEKVEMEKSVKASKARVDSLSQEAVSLEARLQKLTREYHSKKEMLWQLQDLKHLGFGMAELEKLHGLLVQIGTKWGLKPKEAITRFFSDLDDYDAAVGFQREVQRLETVAETRRLEAEKDKLEGQFRNLKEAIAVLQSLQKQGVSANQVLAWHRVLASVGGIEQMGRDLEQYRSMKEVFAACEKRTESVRLKKEQLAAEVSALTDEKAKTIAAIDAVSAAGVSQIAAMRDSAMSGIVEIVKALTQEVTKWGGIKAEEGRLQRELVYARYLTGALPALRTAPKEAVEAFIGASVVWCRSRIISKKIEAPDFLREKHYGLSSYDKFDLLDLMKWALFGLNALEEGDMRLVPDGR